MGANKSCRGIRVKSQCRLFVHVQSIAKAHSIFQMIFQISFLCFTFCHIVMNILKTKSGSFSSVAIQKQPDLAVFVQKPKQNWKKENKLEIFDKNSSKCCKPQQYPVHVCAHSRHECRELKACRRFLSIYHKPTPSKYQGRELFGYDLYQKGRAINRYQFFAALTLVKQSQYCYYHSKTLKSIYWNKVKMT